MGFEIKNIGEYKKREDEKDPSSLNLTKPELEYLLKYIGEGMFKGYEVEQMFYLILKLQQMYLKLESKVD